jgi:hypothetical protein
LTAGERQRTLVRMRSRPLLGALLPSDQSVSSNDTLVIDRSVPAQTPVPT